MDTLDAPDAPFRITTPIDHITKLDDGSVLVHCVVTSEAPDSQGEIVDYDAFKAAAPDLMKWATLGEMHDPGRMDAGTILKLYFDDAGRKVEADLHVVDPVAVRKVVSRTYKSVSIGGVKLATSLVNVSGRTFRKITRMIAEEISLVNRGANPDAAISKQFVIAKRADMEDAGVPSPLGDIAPETSDTRTPEQVAADASVAMLKSKEIAKVKKTAKAAAEAADTEEPKLPFPGAKPPKTKKVAKIKKTASPEEIEEKRLRKEASRIHKMRKAKSTLAKFAKADAVDEAHDAVDAVADAKEGIDEAEAEHADAADAAHDAVAAVADGEDMQKRYKALRKRAEQMRKSRKALAVIAKEGKRIAKIGARNNTGDAKLHGVIHDAVAKLNPAVCAPMGKAEETSTPIAKADTSPDQIEIMRKALEGVIPTAKLEAIEQALATQSEAIAKYGKGSAGGGPATAYAPIFRGPEIVDDASAFAKAAELTSDPRLKESLGNEAALRQISASRR